jgi:hypothetical protein
MTVEFSTCVYPEHVLVEITTHAEAFACGANRNALAQSVGALTYNALNMCRLVRITCAYTTRRCMTAYSFP